MAFSPLNAGYSPLNIILAAPPLNDLARDLKPCMGSNAMASLLVVASLT
jgi:hypothetical protein